MGEEEKGLGESDGVFRQLRRYGRQPFGRGARVRRSSREC